MFIMSYCGGYLLFFVPWLVDHHLDSQSTEALNLIITLWPHFIFTAYNISGMRTPKEERHFRPKNGKCLNQHTDTLNLRDISLKHPWTYQMWKDYYQNSILPASLSSSYCFLFLPTTFHFDFYTHSRWCLHAQKGFFFILFIFIYFIYFIFLRVWKTQHIQAPFRHQTVDCQSLWLSG